MINTNVHFVAGHIVLEDSAYPVDWSRTPAGKLFAFFTVDGQRVRVEIKSDAPYYLEAVTAYRADTVNADDDAAEPDDAAVITAEPDDAAVATVKPTATERVDAERAPAERKPWAGMEIKGRGWEIICGGGYDRIRVVFKRKPTPRIIKAVKDAGFFWSPTLKSWNKKMTNKAFRAAQELAIELRKLTHPNKACLHL